MSKQTQNTSLSLLAVKVETARQSRGWSYWQLAREADLKLDTVQRALGVGAAGESGVGHVGLRTFCTILDVLGLELHVR